jgi:hypothetical protein
MDPELFREPMESLLREAFQEAYESARENHGAASSLLVAALVPSSFLAVAMLAWWLFS